MGERPFSTEFIRALPKTDLHVHLDGSVRLPTLIELAHDCGLALPSYTESGLRELVFKDRYASLGEYLHGFRYTVAALQTLEALERCAYELAIDNQREGVRYLEVRFAPQLHIHGATNAVVVLQAVNRGLQQAQREYNSQPQIAQGSEPSFEYGIICCAMRMFRREFSEYYNHMLKTHCYAPAKEVYQLASLELARAAVIARDEYHLPVVGFDLAGEEFGYPAGDHAAAYSYAHKAFLRKTVHAGEAYGPESIFQAITDLHAERIGHGTSLLDPHIINDQSIQDKDGYVESLGQFIADKRVTLEVCLSSNLQTNPLMQTLSCHTFPKLLKHRLSMTICTDNRTVSNTTVTKEWQLAIEAAQLNRQQLKSLVIYGFKRSFFPGSYLRKRSYVRSVIDYYDAVEKRFYPEAAVAADF